MPSVESSIDLFVLALAGYLFLRLSHVTNYGLLSESGYHVAFRAVLVGLLFYLGGFAIADQYQPSGWLGRALGWIDEHLKVSPAGCWALLLGYIAHLPVNSYYRKYQAILVALRRRGDLIAVLLNDALQTGRMVEVSLEGDKTYIGWVVTTPGVEYEAFHLVPLFSGYRNERQELVVTEDYYDLLEERRQRQETNPEWLLDLGVAIPRSTVRWARYFEITGPLTLPVGQGDDSGGPSPMRP